MSVELLVGGWIRFIADSPNDPVERAAVRFVDINGRLSIDVLVIGGMPAVDWRSVSLARMEATANIPAIAEKIREHQAASARAFELFTASLQMGLVETLPVPDLPEAVIKKPGVRPYPPEFWTTVAEVYRAASLHSRNPAVRIAEASKVPVKTVHGWIMQARRMGALTPGHPGRAG